jgi:hypothetical protein
METYSGIITCSKCNNRLLLKKEDVQWKRGNLYRNLTPIGGGISNTPTKLFFTVCPICSTRNSLSTSDISNEAVREAQEEK